MNHEKLRKAFVQGEERESLNLVRQMVRRIVRAGPYEAMSGKVEALSGLATKPDHGGDWRRMRRHPARRAVQCLISND